MLTKISWELCLESILRRCDKYKRIAYPWKYNFLSKRSNSQEKTIIVVRRANSQSKVTKVKKIKRNSFCTEWLHDLSLAAALQISSNFKKFQEFLIKIKFSRRQPTFSPAARPGTTPDFSKRLSLSSRQPPHFFDSADDADDFFSALMTVC